MFKCLTKPCSSESLVSKLRGRMQQLTQPATSSTIKLRHSCTYYCVNSVRFFYYYLLTIDRECPNRCCHSVVDLSRKIVQRVRGLPRPLDSQLKQHYKSLWYLRASVVQCAIKVPARKQRSTGAKVAGLLYGTEAVTSPLESSWLD